MTTSAPSSQDSETTKDLSSPEKKYRIVYQPAGIPSRCRPEKTILDDAEQVGISLRSDCGGKGKCGRCKVMATPRAHTAPPEANELHLLSAEEIAGGYRLACALYPRGSLQITVPPESLDSLESGDKNRIDESYAIDPMVQRLLISNNQQSPDSRQPLDLVEQLGLPAGSPPHSGY
jgi:uncharacterized 2Fe-2S/4Fe-4S cluster protein (DUF4445 family)